MIAWFRKMREENAMLARLVVRLLPVQAAIVAMGSVNSLVDGVVAARFIDPSTVGVIGLYYTMVRILEAAGAVLLGGVSVLSGRYLGSGRIDRTRGICSLGMALAVGIGAVLTFFSFALPAWIADLLGANAQLREPLKTYILGYAFGIIPLLLGQQIAADIQLERQEKLGHAAVAAMITTNVLFDVLFVAVWHMGVLGLALATSLANLVYFLVVLRYYFTGKAQLLPGLKTIDWGETGELLKIGFPNALLVFCLAARSLVINRLLLACVGSDGLSALSSFNMVCGLILAVAIGAGSLVRILTSVFLGEENREGILQEVRLFCTCVMALMVLIAVIEILMAPVLAALFFPDTGSEVYRLAKQLFTIYGIGIPLTLLCLVYSNYCQAAGFRLLVNILSLTDGFFSMVIPALILAPRLGALGVWLSFPLGLLITLAVSMTAPILHYRRWPRGLEEWLMLPEDFGRGEYLILNLHTLEDVTRTAETVQAFCDARGLTGRTGAHAGLCLEEIAGNVMQHGFHADRRHHVVELRVVPREEGVTLRIKDDCIPFNPQEWYEMTRASSDDPFRNVGIRLVYAVAREVEYQNLLGLNVLTIQL
jgi:Na+-driven multidrug efflux pump/anti-sigma regulatory factor (Ser/Thr protein kinase)